MSPPRRTRLKVCCIADAAELALAVGAGADAIGLVSEVPKASGPVEDRRARALVDVTPPGVSAFLLSSRLDAPGLVAHQKATGARVLQVVDHVEPALLATLRRALPGVALVQVLHVTGPEAVVLARSYHRVAHALLLDSGSPGAGFRELGGTGRTHDWALSARIVAESPVPVWLAGGLHPDNVAEAVRTVQPFGVDLCSGVRQDGALDPSRLHAFVRAIGGSV